MVLIRFLQLILIFTAKRKPTKKSVPKERKRQAYMLYSNIFATVSPVLYPHAKAKLRVASTIGEGLG
jgi:hypothetical protein